MRRFRLFIVLAALLATLLIAAAHAQTSIAQDYTIAGATVQSTDVCSPGFDGERIWHLLRATDTAAQWYRVPRLSTYTYSFALGNIERHGDLIYWRPHAVDTSIWFIGQGTGGTTGCHAGLARVEAIAPPIWLPLITR